MRMNRRPPFRHVAAAVPVLLAVLSACSVLGPGQLRPATPDTTLGPTAVVATTAAQPPAPGETPLLMCTPPACAPGEVYACPSGDCPGGCGTVCDAPTAAPGRPDRKSVV